MKISKTSSQRDSLERIETCISRLIDVWNPSAGASESLGHCKAINDKQPLLNGEAGVLLTVAAPQRTPNGAARPIILPSGSSFLPIWCTSCACKKNCLCTKHGHKHNNNHTSSARYWYNNQKGLGGREYWDVLFAVGKAMHTFGSGLGISVCSAGSHTLAAYHSKRRKDTQQ